MSNRVILLERNAQRAYERGRLKWAAMGAMFLLTACVLGLLVAGRSPAFYAVAAVLAAFGGAYAWRGGDAGNALLPGLIAGLVPMVLSASLLDCRVECSGLCMHHCMTVCGIGAAIGGVAAAVLMRQHPRRHRAWLFAVALIPAVGLLGCPHVGYGQLAGLLIGLAAARAILGVIPSSRSSS